MVSRLLADYGMVFVLALLCAFFSFATYTEQHPTGAEAGRELAASILSRSGKSARVLIAVPNQADAIAFADALQALAADPARRSRQGAAARRLAEARFARADLAEGFVAVLEAAA